MYYIEPIFLHLVDKFDFGESMDTLRAVHMSLDVQLPQQDIHSQKSNQMNSMYQPKVVFTFFL